MTDLRDLLYPDDPAQPKDAYVSARAGMKKKLPQRFYTAVTVEDAEGGFAIALDGRRVRTPGGAGLMLARRAAAELVAAEWAAQATEIDPAAMPATRIANVGIDRVGAVRDAVIAEMTAYAGNDLVCYRAGTPEELVAEEDASWAPVLDHALAKHGARFVLAEGIGPVDQPPASLAAVEAAFARVADPVALAALHTLVTIAGSALIALAFADRAMDAEAAFAAASVDEDWNARLWGADAEAEFRRARRWQEFSAAAALFRALA